MPCNSDYLGAHPNEIKISRVACLLDELKGKSFDETHWNGYHPSVYNQCTKTLADSLVKELCSKLSTLNVSKYSLEMQIWWRDHQKADKERQQKEKQELAEKKIKEKALSKLTDTERKLLGL